MTSVHELRQAHPLVFPLGIVAACCLIVLVGMRIHLGHLNSEARSDVRRTNNLKEKCDEYQKLQARTGGGVELLKNPEALTTWGVEQIAGKAGLTGRVKDTVRNVDPHDDLLERLVTISLIGVHRRELVDNPGPDASGGFLQRVEAEDTAIRTKTLEVTPNRTDPKLIDAKVTFSAYEPRSSTKP